MHYLGLDGHDFISDRLNDFTARFDWVICNNTIIKNAKNDARPPRTICMKTDFLPKYVDLIASLGSETGGGFVLLTCSSMYSPAYHYPDETRRILENPHLVAWFSENNTMAEGAAVNPHPKMRHFPAGLNFHNSELQMECERALLQISAEGGGAEVPARNFLYCPPHGRELLNDNYCKTFCGVSRNLIRGEPFSSAASAASAAVDYYYIGAKNPTSPIADQYRDYYQSLKQYKFLLCPHEATIDPCPPRVWEALALGVIPVMIHNTLSENLYRGLPIWFIEDWSKIFDSASAHNQLCKKYRELMRASPYSPHQLTADYWFDRVNRAFSGMSPEVCPATGNCFLPKPRDYIEQKKQVSFSAEVIESSPPMPPPIQKTPRIVFAFCIYGSNPMYYSGLNENIRIISREFDEDAHVYIYAGTSAILSNLYRDNDTTHVFETGHDGVINMIYRYSGVIAAAAAMAADVKSPEFYFVRDADSIIGDRDLWCIRDFIATAISSANITAHVIRDHFHHKSKMTGGLTGFTKLGMSLVSDTFRAKIADFHQGDYSVYGNDEEFLNQHIYPLLFDGTARPLVHSNFCVMPGEIHRPILAPNTLTNFCGNVRQIVPFPHFQFLYSDFDVNAQWKWCAEHEAYALFIQTILSLRRTYRNFNDSDLDPHAIDAKRLYGGLKELPYSSRSRTLAYLIEAYLHCGDINGCYAAYQLYAYCEIHERAKELMWDVIRAQTRIGVPLLLMTSGCTEGYEAMKDYSVCAPIIVYGAFADDWTAYPCSQIIYRNVWYYERDRAECEKRDISFEWIENSVWTPVKKIYIMGLDVAPDRIYETKQELARVGISLDKIQPYLAKKDADRNGAYLGATKNHADVLAAALNALSEQPPKMDEANSSVFLFLEDDFVFSGDPTERLCEFWKRKYDYDICLLAASKMHERAELDDLISYSKQYCTTSSAYFVPARADTLEKVAALVLEGYEKMKETGDTVTYCIDRYWTKIQPANHMILFREKLGFQRPSMSKITGALNAMLD